MGNTVIEKGVNVTDFLAPNAEDIITAATGWAETTSVDPHVVNTAYDFTWPSGGKLSSALNFSNDSLCVSAATIEGMPANVSNFYTEDNTDNTDCAPVLGASCVAAIARSLTSRREGTGCYLGTDSWWSMHECSDILGYAYNQNLKHGAGIIAWNLNSANRSSDHLSGDGVWGAMQDARNATNTTNYDTAVNQLQILLLDLVVNGSRSGAGFQMLCMRVNTSHLEETTGDGTDGESAASSRSYLSGPESLMVIRSLILATVYSR